MSWPTTEEGFKRRIQELEEHRDNIEDEIDNLRRSLASLWAKSGKVGPRHFIDTGIVEYDCWCPYGEDHDEEDWVWIARDGTRVTR